MNISEAQYTTSEKNIIRIVEGSNTRFVPVDPANRHYEEILEQVKAGTLTIKDAD
tara:strand:- start:1039 stop:1203 length:165 start_codon:yes stop_codon:yes gene_type:complete